LAADASYLVAMSLRMPQFMGPEFRFKTGADTFADEMAGETAAALGRMGRGVERALAALREGESNGVDAAARETLVRSAADAVWSYFVQREICGVRSQKDAIDHYAIPREVLNRVGAR
jgi:hypothetical protein